MSVAATRIGRDLDFLIAGGSALYYLDSAYLIGGTGAIWLLPQGLDSETTLAWTAGIGHEFGSWRLELRDYMSFFDFDPSPGTTWHNVIFLVGAFMFRL